MTDDTPCWHCGRPMQLVTVRGYHYIQCDHCKIGTGPARTPAGALEKWAEQSGKRGASRFDPLLDQIERRLRDMREVDVFSLEDAVQQLAEDIATERLRLTLRNE